jgi:5-methylcytosine-specific restriction endonuclease McrA
VANRKWHLKTMYGLTLEQYEAMLIAQHGVCAVCRQPETALRRGTVKSLDVDHNHTTNQIRGLLCSACNNSLGMLREDPLRIRALAEYIERHNAK